MDRVDRYSEQLRSGACEIMVGVTYDGVTDELHRHGLRQRGIALVSPRPFISESTDLAGKAIRAPNEVHPVSPWRQLITERVQGRHPADAGFGVDKRAHGLCWHSGGHLPAHGELQSSLLRHLPCMWSLPADCLLLSQHRVYGAAAPWADLHLQDARFQQQPVMVDAGKLQPPS